MTSYLLDTSVLSILDPRRAPMPPELEAWLTVRVHRLHLSTVTVFETAQGLEQLTLRGQTIRAAELEAWLAGVVSNFGDRVLPLDVEVARAAGTLSAKAFAMGNHPGSADIMIAATARVHDLLLLTRNMKHFAGLGINVTDPTVSLPR